MGQQPVCACQWVPCGGEMTPCQHIQQKNKSADALICGVLICFWNRHHTAGIWIRGTRALKWTHFGKKRWHELICLMCRLFRGQKLLPFVVFASRDKEMELKLQIPCVPLGVYWGSGGNNEELPLLQVWSLNVNIKMTDKQVVLLNPD